jgi:histidinol dehydrogenase
MVSIDMPAGPSEVLVIADKYANPVHVAADLLSQVSSFPVTLLCCVEKSVELTIVHHLLREVHVTPLNLS